MTIQSGERFNHPAPKSVSEFDALPRDYLGVKLPSSAGIMAGDRAAYAAAKDGSDRLLRAINRYLDGREQR